MALKFQRRSGFVQGCSLIFFIAKPKQIRVLYDWLLC